MRRFDFANILFSGPCNLRCRDCIGRALPPRASNLHRFPPAGIERFTELLLEHGAPQLTLTGTDTDPLLYRHQDALLDELRRRAAGVKISLHTNGLLALRQIDRINRYDRVTLSLCSFDPETCRRMTGRAFVLDLERILDRARVPIKTSTLVTEENIDEVPGILSRCRALGIRRAVLRLRHGERRTWPLFRGLTPTRSFAGNPVYDLSGLEVTLWDFARCTLRALNLFSDGSITSAYELTRGDHAPRG